MCRYDEKKIRRHKRLRRIVRKAFSKRAAQGSVTIFLLIIMLPMLIFSFSVMDLCKIFMAKSVQESSADLALSAALTSYDKVLKDMYGIMATSSSQKDLTDKVTKYYVATLESSGLSVDDTENVHKLLADIFKSSTGIPEGLSTNESLLKITASDIQGKNTGVQAKPVSVSAVSNPIIMHRQIVEYMKLRAPAYLVSGMLEKVNAFGDMNNQVEATNAKVTFEQTLSDINNKCIEAYTLFDLYFYNNEWLETGSASLTIPYQNEQSDNITKYKYTGQQFIFKETDRTVGMYWGGKVNVIHALHTLEWAVRESMIYGDYINCYKNGNSVVLAGDISGMLDYDTSVKKDSHVSYSKLSGDLSAAYNALIGLKEEYDIATSENEFRNEIDKRLNAVNEYRNYEMTNVQSYEDFITAINNNNTFADGKNILIEYLPLYKDASDKQNDFSKAAKEFIKAYSAAKLQYNNDINDDDCDLEALEALDDILGETETALKKLKYATDNIKKLVDDAHSSADAYYQYIVTTYNNVMTALCKQIDIIDKLTGDSGLLDDIYKDFEKAQEDAKK